MTQRILIANNGIAAVKGIRSIRQWVYETQRTIELIAMASEDDLNVQAEFIKLADKIVKVPGGSNKNNYANVNLIVDIAKTHQCDAVWPGWGHASENPALPERLSKENILFIGPDSKAMRALGDKIGAMILAQSAGVPCIPWNGQDIQVMSMDTLDKVYSQATIADAHACLEWCNKIGYPCMIKASEGGGGKGIRKVTEASQVQDAFYQVKQEVMGSPIFVMKTATEVRHVEVQLLADHFNHAISIYGRDCSVQRRHQKIIEESPASIVPPAIMLKMQSCAVELAKLVHYRSTGTVEYLYEPDTQSFYFLELNPRLQVEHPCTEMISGINLPACQVQVAMGMSLHDIEALGPFLKTPPTPLLHVIAARITAENPDMGFLPSGGTMEQLSFHSRSNVWGYFSVGNKGALHDFADSQFGHIFSQGHSRNEARTNLIMALKDLSIHSEFKTSVAYLIKLMETPTFIDNAYTTEWLDGMLRKKSLKTFDEDVSAALYGSVYHFHMQAIKRDMSIQMALDNGILPHGQLFKRDYTFTFILNGVQYTVQGYECMAHQWMLTIGEATVELQVMPIDKGLLIHHDHSSTTVYGNETPQQLEISFKNCFYVLEKDLNKNGIKSTSSGKWNKWCLDGTVTKGDIIGYMEVMKMITPVYAPRDGVLRQLVQAQDTILMNQLIAEYSDHVQDQVPMFNGVVPSSVKHGHAMEMIDDMMQHYYPKVPIQRMKQMYREILDEDLPFVVFKKAFLHEEHLLEPVLVLEIEKAWHDKALDRLLALIPHHLTSYQKLVPFQHGITAYQMTLLSEWLMLYKDPLWGLNDVEILQKQPTVADLWHHYYHQYKTEWLQSLLMDLDYAQLNGALLDALKQLSQYPIPMAIHAKRILLNAQVPSYGEKRLKIIDYLKDRRIDALCKAPFFILDGLIEQFFTEHRTTAMQCYLKRTRGIQSDCSSQGVSFEEGMMIVVDKLGPLPKTKTLFVCLYNTGYSDSEWIQQMTPLVDHAFVCFIVYQPRDIRYFTFVEGKEMSLQRHVDPSLVMHLELDRLCHFDLVSVPMQHFQVYHATAKENPSDERLFLRALVRPEGDSPLPINEYLMQHGHQLMQNILHALQIALSQYPKCKFNHIFVKYLPHFSLEMPLVYTKLHGLILKYASSLIELHCNYSEIHFTLNGDTYRFMASSEDYMSLQMKVFLDKQGLQELDMETKTLKEKHPLLPHTPLSTLQCKRHMAILYKTTYVMDIPKLFCNKASSEVLFTPCGMVAWQVHDQVPYVVIANDMTHHHGSFGVEESDYYCQVAQYCLDSRLPMIYFSCNSGARISMTEHGGRHLSFCAKMAGITSELYRTCITIAIVSSRSVGIGAYLNRLMRRVIQRVDSPLLLTGKDALNKLLQKTVYTSNLQLGGPDVMHRNGVAHTVVSSDEQAMREAIGILSYQVKMKDTRDVMVSFGEYRQCLLSEGADGLLDRDSFKEVQDNYAKTIIGGRGRIKGMPVGVICMYNKVMEEHVLADPADTASEQINKVAPHVWYPQGAFKTAQLIEDFGREKLPLLIMANMRGFSGGQTDMYHQVLKYGAMIVDQLRLYKQPVIVYVVPFGELRGGSWVVLDPQINPKYMSLFIDETSKGNILEPDGLVAIKMKPNALLKLYKEMYDADATEIPSAKVDMIKGEALRMAENMDTSTAMMESGAIKQVLKWEETRLALYTHFEEAMEALKKSDKLTEKCARLGIVEPDVDVSSMTEAEMDDLLRRELEKKLKCI